MSYHLLREIIQPLKELETLIACQLTQVFDIEDR